MCRTERGPRVTVVGEIDISTAPSCDGAWPPWWMPAGTDPRRPRRGRLPDWTALSVLIGAHRRLERQGRDLELVCTNAPVLRVLA